MKNNFASINVIMDRSGSMHNLTNDTIGGFNQFLKDQKAIPGEAILTLCTFSTDYTLVYDCKPLQDVAELTEADYSVGGGTSLLDALGNTILSVGNKLASMPEDDRPSKVIVLVITDGEENSSREFNKKKIKEMVDHQQTTYGWEFLYFGANVDAIKEGNSMGFQNNTNYIATNEGTQSLYRSVSNSVVKSRTSKKD
jgi:uncharacterized protein YegL